MVVTADSDMTERNQAIYSLVIVQLKPSFTPFPSFRVFPSSRSEIVLAASPAISLYIHCHFIMKTAYLFAVISLAFSVSAAATVQGDPCHDVNSNDNGNIRNKGSEVILFLKCRCLNLLIIVLVIRVLEAHRALFLHRLSFQPLPQLQLKVLQAPPLLQLETAANNPHSVRILSPPVM